MKDLHIVDFWYTRSTADESVTRKPDEHCDDICDIGTAIGIKANESIEYYFVPACNEHAISPAALI